jgi:hypothetical protein
MATIAKQVTIDRINEYYYALARAEKAGTSIGSVDFWSENKLHRARVSVLESHLRSLRDLWIDTLLNQAIRK